MSLLRLLEAFRVAVRNGAVSFREYYRTEVDPLTRDLLTLVWNRPQFERRRNGTPRYALLLIDIDNFKQINDSLGHHAGDVVLQAVANALRTGSGDRVFRVGGEEFAVLLAGCLPQDAVKVAERLRETVQRLTVFADPLAPSPRAPVTVSVGVAWTGPRAEPSTDHDGVYKKADRALYYAKWKGKNRVALFDECPELAAELASVDVVLKRGKEAESSRSTVRPWGT